MAGADFEGTDELEFNDVQDWIVDSGAEATKQKLDDLEWNGDAVVAVSLTLSPDNKKVVNGKILAMGELMKGIKDFRANRIFERADKDLRVSYMI